MSGRFASGLDITTESLGMFRENTSLALIPALSLLTVGSAFAISSSLATFFNAAVVHCAAKIFDGEPTSARDGLAAAWRVRRQIAVWALVSATLGTVLMIIDEKFGAIGSLARALFDLAWALLTFFIVPVIVLEETDGIQHQLRQSGHMFKETWGESVSASLGVSLVFFVVALPGIAALAAGYFVLHGAVAVLVGAVGGLIVVGSMVASQTVSAIVRVALYRYAATDDRMGPLAAHDPAQLFPEK